MDIPPPLTHCGVVMRETSAGYECPVCEHVEEAPAVEYPRFDGPSIHGG